MEDANGQARSPRRKLNASSDNGGEARGSSQSLSGSPAGYGFILFGFTGEPSPASLFLLMTVADDDDDYDDDDGLCIVTRYLVLFFLVSLILWSPNFFTFVLSGMVFRSLFSYTLLLLMMKMTTMMMRLLMKQKIPRCCCC
jgi:hypothetical protein